MLQLSWEVISTADNAPYERQVNHSLTAGILDKSQAIAIADFLDFHQCENTVAIDIGGISDVAEFFLIATVNSSTHLLGVHGHLLRYLKERAIKPVVQHRTNVSNPWLIIDLGIIVIHLMERTTRDFYELEKLWFGGRIVR